MDFTSLWFLLLMIVVGGGIAVIADNLGRKLGKQRLRLGKLRPRHTAMLFTALTGAVVTLITILLVAALSAEVREWIIKGRGAVKESTKLLAERDKMDGEVRRALDQIRIAKENLDKMGKRLERDRNETLRLQGDLNQAKGKVSLYEGKALKAAGDLQGIQVKLTEREKKLDELEKTRQKAQKAYSKLDDIYKKLDSTYKQLHSNYEELSHQREEAYSRNQELDKQNQALEKAIGDLNSKRSELETNLEGLNTRIDRLNGDLNLLNQKYTTASQVAAIIAEGTHTAPVIFNRNQEVARREASSVLSLQDARDVIKNVAAVAFSTAADATGKPAYYIRTALRDNPIRPDQVEEEAARAVLDAKGPVVIIVFSAFNTFQGESAPLDIHVQPNPIAFKAGEVLGEIRIDGSQEVEQILAQISQLLQTQVRQKAEKAGMIGTGGPNSQFGQLDFAATYRLVSQIKAIGRPARLQAVAKNNTRIAGPLEIDFKAR